MARSDGTVIRLAFSSNAFVRFGLEQAVYAIAQAGYEGVELMADVPHAYPPQLSAHQRRQIRQLLRQNNLTVSNINAFTLFALGDTYHPSWLEPDGVSRRRRIDHTLRCIELAAELGASNVSTEPGAPMNEFDPRRRSELISRFAEILNRYVLPHASEHDVVLAVEPEPGLVIETSQQFLQLQDQIDQTYRSYLRLNCDLGHFYCVGEDPAEVLRTLAEHIQHVHIEDIAGSRIHQHLLPGTGTMNFAAIFDSLQKIEYHGWVTVELYPYQDRPRQAAESALRYLRRFVR